MSELDKMMAFGHWLEQRRLQFQAELCALSIDRSKPIDAIRVKAGHLECAQLTLQAFSDLYNGDLGKFMHEYLGQPLEDEEESEEDVPHS
jgi:hypothetical protein